MAGPIRNPAVEDLAPLEGRWRMEARFPTGTPAPDVARVCRTSHEDGAWRL